MEVIVGAEVLWVTERKLDLVRGAEATCGMPTRYCPEELGGAHYFVRGRSDWSPSHEHFPVAKRFGGKRTVDNSVLAHRLCNRLDYSIAVGRSHQKDLDRIIKARETAAAARARDATG